LVAIVHVRPWIVAALVPSLGALLQRFVVALLVLLDQPFNAEVTIDLKTQVISLEQ
jgi:hypothetical protein